MSRSVKQPELVVAADPRRVSIGASKAPAGGRHMLIRENASSAARTSPRAGGWDGCRRGDTTRPGMRSITSTQLSGSGRDQPRHPHRGRCRTKVR